LKFHKHLKLLKIILETTSTYIKEVVAYFILTLLLLWYSFPFGVYVSGAETRSWSCFPVFLENFRFLLRFRVQFLVFGVATPAPC